MRFGSTIKRLAVLSAILTLADAALAGRAVAQAGETFMGATLEGAPGTYLATKTANLRDAPGNNGNVLDKIQKGTKVQVRGRAQGTSWLAVSAIGDGEVGEKGFAYAPVFLPLIDGTLEETVAVKVASSAGPACEASIVFEGKTVVEEDMFEIADYEAVYQCGSGKDEVVFTAYMFMTEAPFDLSDSPRYQINVDLREVGDAYDEPFSAVFIYDHGRGQIIFDGLSLDGYGRTPSPKPREVATPADAVAAAAEMAPGTWNKKVWDALRAPPPAGQ